MEKKSTIKNEGATNRPQDVTQRRRQWEAARIRQSRYFSVTELMQKFPGTTSDMKLNDIEWMQKWDPAIKQFDDPEGGEMKFIGYPPEISSTKNSRKDILPEEKHEIAKVCVGLIWGPKAKTKPSKEADEDLSEVFTQERILAALNQVSSMQHLGNHDTTKRIQPQLANYWEKSHRTISIDAGTTTGIVGELLAKLKVPDLMTRLSSLDVFTNSSDILHLFSDGKVSVGVALIGGRLRKDTDAITGELARQCLEKWQLHLDLAVVGTTNINSHTFELSCDSEDEALTKSVMLSRASLRCVAVTSNKFSEAKSSFIFGALHPNSIDILITDHLVPAALVDKIQQCGVVVLRADEPDHKLG